MRAFGRGTTNRDALCATGEALGLKVIKAASAREALEGADLIVTTVTFSPDVEPFLDARWLSPGTFATITDFAAPWEDDGMVAFDRIVVDDTEQELKSEMPLVNKDLIDGDVSGLVLGEVTARKNAQERTAFVFRGLALGDLAMAVLAYERATSD